MIAGNAAILGLDNTGPIILVRPGALVAAALTRASKAWSDTTAGLQVEAANDMARFRGSAQRLLVEGARTNLLADARTAFRTNWTNSGIATAITTTGPDGGAASGTLVTESTGSGTHRADSPAFALTTGLSYAVSVLARPGGCQNLQVFGGNTAFGTNFFANFVLSGAGTVGSLGSAVTRATIELLASGWYLLRATGTAASSATAAIALCMGTASSDLRSPSYAGTGRDFTAGWIWVEQAAFGSTPILPPAGAPAQSTRATDAPLWTPPASYGLRGTILVKAMLPQSAPAGGLGQGLACFSAGISNNNRISLRNTAGGNSIQALVTGGGTTLATLTLGSMTPGSVFAAGVTWEDGYVAGVMAGVTAPLPASPVLPSGLSQLLVGHLRAGADAPAFGEIEAATAFLYRMSEAEMSARLAAL